VKIKKLKNTNLSKKLKILKKHDTLKSKWENGINVKLRNKGKIWNILSIPENQRIFTNNTCSL
jgi:1,2-phenylacetyl-CoA epoxidase catalytic subunit